MNYLIKTTEVYRCDTEKEANELIKDAKASSDYTVSKSSIEVRSTKVKGEIVDEWKRVTITKNFTSEKEPDGDLMPVYEVPET